MVTYVWWDLSLFVAPVLNTCHAEFWFGDIKMTSQETVYWPCWVVGWEIALGMALLGWRSWARWIANPQPVGCGSGRRLLVIDDRWPLPDKAPSLQTTAWIYNHIYIKVWDVIHTQISIIRNGFHKPVRTKWGRDRLRHHWHRLEFHMHEITECNYSST